MDKLDNNSELDDEGKLEKKKMMAKLRDLDYKKESVQKNKLCQNGYMIFLQIACER